MDAAAQQQARQAANHLAQLRSNLSDGVRVLWKKGGFVDGEWRQVTAVSGQHPDPYIRALVCFATGIDKKDYKSQANFLRKKPFGSGETGLSLMKCVCAAACRVLGSARPPDRIPPTPPPPLSTL